VYIRCIVATVVSWRINTGKELDRFGSMTYSALELSRGLTAVLMRSGACITATIVRTSPSSAMMTPIQEVCEWCLIISSAKQKDF